MITNYRELYFLHQCNISCASRAERSKELTAVFSGERSEKCIETILRRIHQCRRTLECFELNNCTHKGQGAAKPCRGSPIGFLGSGICMLIGKLVFTILQKIEIR